jgi:hypothetical protein
MPNWFERFKAANDGEDNEINKSVIDELQKEARSYELNPYDSANISMLSDSKGKSDYYYDVGGRGAITYHQLENLTKHPIVSSILQTRINQVAEFARFTDDDDLGFSIKLKDAEAEPSDDDKETMKMLRAFIENCGSEPTDFELNFENFLKQIVRDSLAYDQCNFEIVRNRLGEVVAFQPVDAKTVRRAKLSESEIKAGRRDKDRAAYVQVISNKVVAEYSQKDLCFGIRRPRTDLSSLKYGYPELEELVGVIQNIYQAETYNASNFTNGINANGIIAVKSKMNPNLFRAFRREFYQMLNGVQNAKRTPLIQLDPEGDEAISSINLSNSNKEMEYDNWLKYLIKLSCSVFQMDPAEIGFVFGNEGSGNSFVTADPNARILMGKEKGLRPLIRSIEGWINKYIISQIDDRFEITFNYLDSISLLDKMKVEEHRMKYLTLNEIRASHDLTELEDGDVVAAYYAQLKVAGVKAGIADITQDIDKSVDTDNDGESHPSEYFEGLDEDTKRKREKEIERRKKVYRETGKPVYGPLPGDEDIEKAKQNKGTKSKKADEVREEIKKPGKDEFIRAASKVSGVSKKIIEEVYDKGLAAYATSGHRPGATPQSWSRARVYSFLFDSKSGARKVDMHLWEEHLESKKSVSNDNIPNEEEIKTEINVDTLLKAYTYKPTQTVADVAQRAIDAREEHGDKVKGGTRVGWTRARQLANRDVVSYDTVRRMKAFFDRHEKNKEVSEEDKDFPWADAGYTAWQIWAGDEGRAWAEMIVERVKKEEEDDE